MQQRHNCSPAASFASCVMTLYLLKVHLQTFLSIPITQKCQIFSCDTLVANERYGEVAVKLRSFLTSALGGGEWSASRFGRLKTISVTVCSTLRCHMLLLLLRLLLLLLHHNSGRVLAFSTKFFHLRRTWTRFTHFISFIFLRSFLTSSSHWDLGLPTVYL